MRMTPLSRRGPLPSRERTAPRAWAACRSRNLAARAGRWSARHRKIVIFGWLAFVVAAFMLGGAVGQKELQRLEHEAPVAEAA
jgi:hypothetical protein